MILRFTLLTLLLILPKSQNQVTAWKEVTKFSFTNRQAYIHDFYDVLHKNNYLINLGTDQEDPENFGKKTNNHGAADMFVNISRPILFSGIQYYLKEDLLDPDAWKICEYQVSDMDLIYRIFYNSSGKVTKVESYFYECGILSTCKGLECAGPGNWVLGVIGLAALLVMFGVGAASWKYRKAKKQKMMTKETMMRGLENKT